VIELTSPCEYSSRHKAKDVAGYIKINKKHYGFNYLHRKVYSEHHNIELKSTDFIMHLCDNPSCINIEHLQLGDAKLNMQDKVNKCRQQKGEKVHSAKLKQEDIDNIRFMYHFLGMSQIEIAKEYDVNNVQICRIVNNKNWKE
jgi:hypothetical protein